MQQIMEGLKFLNKIAVLAISMFLLVGCSPREPRLELQLVKQQTGRPFSFADYCEGEYDSICLIYPYFNVEREDFVNLKMSKILRRVCDKKTMFDSLSTILFISNNTVKAYSIVEVSKVRITPPGIPENKYIFPFEQKFILDEKRYVHIYEE
jgi:hypothetical protein